MAVMLNILNYSESISFYEIRTLKKFWREAGDTYKCYLTFYFDKVKKKRKTKNVWVYKGSSINDVKMFLIIFDSPSPIVMLFGTKA